MKACRCLRVKVASAVAALALASGCVTAGAAGTSEPIPESRVVKVGTGGFMREAPAGGSVRSYQKVCKTGQRQEDGQVGVPMAEAGWSRALGGQGPDFPYVMYGCDAH